MQSVAKRAGLVATANLFRQFALLADPVQQVLSTETLSRLWSLAVDLTNHDLFLGMDIDAQQDHFRLLGGLLLFYGCIRHGG